MKRLVAIIVAFLIVVVVFMSSALAENWKPIAEVAIGIHSGITDEHSGELLYNETVFNQTAAVGMEKGVTGFYLQVENFSPSGGEARSTYFYGGFYTKIAGINLDAGYARYQIREKGALDYNGIYATAEFPSIGWQITPFIKAEYRFAGMFIEEGIDDIGDPVAVRTSMDGLIYYAGLKREFQIGKWLSIIPELGLGGNTGIYGMPAESLSFFRGKLDVVVPITEWCKFNVSALTQHNLGKMEGVAAGTDKLFVSAVVTWTF